MNTLTNQHIEELISFHLSAQKEAIIKSILNDKSEFLTCVCLVKLVREAYVLEPPKLISDIFKLKAVPY